MTSTACVPKGTLLLSYPHAVRERERERGVQHKWMRVPVPIASLSLLRPGPYCVPVPIASLSLLRAHAGTRTLCLPFPKMV